MLFFYLQELDFVFVLVLRNERFKGVCIGTVRRIEQEKEIEG